MVKKDVSFRMKLLILADDFTGAMDTGTQLSSHYIKTLVEVLPGGTPCIEPCEVLVINTDTRHDTPMQAYDKLMTLLNQYARHSAMIYLKTDSALRGNISSSIYALQAFRKAPVMFVPAYPAAGRTTKDGHQYVGGVPLEESVFSKDPLNPMLTGDVADIVSQHCPVHCIPVKAEEAEGFLAQSPLDNTCYIFDCEDNQTLVKISERLKKQSLLHTAAGCAGFASTFSEVIPFQVQESPSSITDGPFLLLSGSANAITFKQLQQAERAHYPIIKIPHELKFAEHLDNHPLLDELCTKAAEVIRGGRSVIVTTATSKEDLQDFGQSGRSSEALHSQMSDLFARVAESLLHAVSLHNLVVFGGDTSLAILKRLECSRVQALGEIQTGVPLCVFHDGGKEIHLITKSGGLGTKDVVQAIEHYIKSQGGQNK